LTDAFRHVDSDNVLMELTSNAGPAIIHSEHDKTFIQLVMPIRMD